MVIHLLLREPIFFACQVKRCRSSVFFVRQMGGVWYYFSGLIAPGKRTALRSLRNRYVDWSQLKRRWIPIIFCNVHYFLFLLLYSWSTANYSVLQKKIISPDCRFCCRSIWWFVGCTVVISLNGTIKTSKPSEKY